MRGRGGSGSGSGRGRGDLPPTDFDIFDFPVQIWPEHDSTYLCFVFRPGRVRTIDLTLLFRPSTIRDSERPRKRIRGERI